MYVRHLGLRDFRSWANVELELTPGRTVFVGPNGYGKTNLVEALWYSSTLGSHRVATDAPLVRVGATAGGGVDDRGQRGPRMRGRPGDHGRAGQQSAIEPFAGAQPPRGGRACCGRCCSRPRIWRWCAETRRDRRRYLDDLATVRRPRVAAVRADYDKVLRQRTALLKSASGARFRGDRGALDTLDVWDGHLAAHGAELMAARMTW